jgi:Endonuclease/Exonuclease/phosphatase family
VKDPSGTSDLRGIDVSLAYDDRKLSVVDKHSHVVHLRYQTRDIFEVVFKVKDTNEEFVVIASHWPSRRHGRLESEPLRIALAENIAFLVRDHVRVDSVKYEQLRKQNNLGPVKKSGRRRYCCSATSTTSRSTSPSSTTFRPQANSTG